MCIISSQEPVNSERAYQALCPQCLKRGVAHRMLSVILRRDGRSEWAHRGREQVRALISPHCCVERRRDVHTKKLCLPRLRPIIPHWLGFMDLSLLIILNTPHQNVSDKMVFQWLKHSWGEVSTNSQFIPQRERIVIVCLDALVTTIQF